MKTSSFEWDQFLKNLKTIRSITMNCKENKSIEGIFDAKNISLALCEKLYMLLNTRNSGFNTMINIENNPVMINNCTTYSLVYLPKKIIRKIILYLSVNDQLNLKLCCSYLRQVVWSTLDKLKIYMEEDEFSKKQQMEYILEILEKKRFTENITKFQICGSTEGCEIDSVYLYKLPKRIEQITIESFRVIFFYFYFFLFLFFYFSNIF